MSQSGSKIESRQIGEGTRIWGDTHVLKGASIGRNCNIGEGCFIENDVRIGNGVVIKNGVSVWDRIQLGDNVFVGPNAVFTNDPFPRAHPAFRTGPAGWRQTVVEAGASIGANATIVCGVTIGSWAVIGAGAVVTKNVGAHELWLGVPARRVGWACLCGRPLPEDLACECGLAWVMANGALSPSDPAAVQARLCGRQPSA